MSDITNLKRMLAQQAQSVAEYLLPGGRKEGTEWRAGSTGGERGKSLGVHLTGAKAGLWRDFGSSSEDDGGDLIDLWCQVRGKDLIGALDEIRTWLGVERPKAFYEPKRTYVKPPRPKAHIPKAQALDYLRTNRFISNETITAYKLAEMDDGRIVFPFLDDKGELVLVKAREPKDGAKPVPTAKDCQPICFGWQAIPKDARTVVVTEGEIDALSMYQLGHPALSVPFGGGGGNKQQWIEHDFERFERFEKIYLALDMDKQGDAAVAEIAHRLGRHRCVRVKLPYKDANEALVRGLPADMMQDCLDAAEGLDPEGLRHASDFTEAVVRLFYPEDEMHVGYCMPYHAVRDKLHFRPGEVTLWSGASGSGKSQLLSDCTSDWINQGSMVCISSLEMAGRYLMKRMVKQVGNVDRPSEEYIHQITRWMDNCPNGGGLLVYERLGKAKIDELIEVFNYARARYGCDQFIIDSLMRLGIDGDDYTGQERIMFALVDWVIENNVHLHLVAHARKGSREYGVPEIEDVKGAMEIGANAFNVVIVTRNRKLERDIEELEKKSYDDAEVKKELDELKQRPGVMLNVCKQRNGDWEGICGLFFNRQTYRYRSAQCSTSRNYIPY